VEKRKKVERKGENYSEGNINTKGAEIKSKGCLRSKPCIEAVGKITVS
jgi:hypothetical protein